MSFNYAKTAATADRLIGRFGASATFQQITVGAYDPNTGTAGNTVTSVPVQAVVLPYGQRFIDGATILQGDLQAFLSVVGVSVPKAGDQLLWQGKTYQIISVKDTAPAGLSVIYELQVRGAA